MRCFKFVTADLKSPRDFGKRIDYSKFGKEITVDAAPHNAGQCAAGIHVLPYCDNLKLNNVIVSKKIVILNVNKKDIVYKDGNGKMRVKAATPVRVAKIDAINTIRKFICNSVDSEGFFALKFAEVFDGKPHILTRKAACRYSRNAYYYALNVDKKPSDVTRRAASKDSYIAYLYARDIDKRWMQTTWNAVQKDKTSKAFYIQEIGSKKEWSKKLKK